MATGAPGTNGVWQYGEDDSEATFSALLNKAASTTDTQIGADRTRLTALEARKISVLNHIVPTAVTYVGGGTGSVNSTTGKVTFTTCTGVILRNCFNSTYQNYRIIITLKATTSGDAQLYARLANAGTERTGASYNQAGNRNNTSTGGMAVDYRASTTYSRLAQNAVTSTGYTQSVLDVMNPYDSTRVTSWNYQSVGHYGYIQMETGGTMYAVTESEDGFGISITAGTMTGEIIVMGYNS